MVRLGRLWRPIVAAAVVVACWSLTAAAQQALSGYGGLIYRQNCAQCHDEARERTPSRAVLAALPPEAIVAALMRGSMRAQGARLGAEEIAALTVFLTGKAPGATEGLEEPNRCRDDKPVDLAREQWNGWGRDLDNSRYQPTPGLAAADVPKLQLKWAFGYPGIMTYGQPTLIGDRVYVASMTGQVFSLDAASGCTYWRFRAQGPVRTAISVGALTASKPSPVAAYFADEQANVYALDARSGAVLWQNKLGDHRFARVVGAPTLYQGHLYVPESSPEEALARSSRYGCCTFRGSVTAFDVASGEQLWKTFTIAPAPQPTHINREGVQMYGPAGAAVWSAPTIDRKRNLIYVATGNSYTEVATSGADAIIAIDAATGAIRWTNQLTPHDDYIVGCSDLSTPSGNCPPQVGPDFDFGASPILHTLPDGRQLILAGQKSGMVYGLDPDADGKVMWQVHVGRGTALGGIEWGLAADDVAVYAAISDVIPTGRAAGGLTALKIATGETLWHVPAPPPDCGDDRRRCTAAQSAAVTVIPGVVFSGSQDGHLRAYATHDGSIVWDYDTKRDYPTVNGVPGRGGSLDTAGPTVANGMLFANSGYGKFFGLPGNVLLAFTVGGR